MEQSTPEDITVYGCKQSDYPYIDVQLFDFRNFVCAAFEFQRLPSPTTRQMEIAWWMQWGPKRQQTQAFRGEGKSILAEMFCAWGADAHVLRAAPGPPRVRCTESVCGRRSSRGLLNLRLQPDHELGAPRAPQAPG